MSVAHPQLQAKDLPQFIVDDLRIGASRGTGAHIYMYKMACNLLPWRDENETFRLIRSAIPDAKVPDKEIWSSINYAIKKGDLWSPDKQSSPKPKVEAKPFDRDEWLAKHCPYEITVEEVEAVSPSHQLLNESEYPAWKASIAAGYRRDEVICIQRFSDDTPPQKADTVSNWLKESRPFGQFLCINPVKTIQGVPKQSRSGSKYYSVRCLENILERRYAAIEFDSYPGTKINVPIETQLRIHSWLSTKLPLLLLVHSGKRSVHGFYLVFGMTDEAVKALYLFLGNLGVDKACSDASRLTRLPGAMRHDRDENGKIAPVAIQKLLYLNPSVSGASKTPQGGLRELALKKGSV